MIAAEKIQQLVEQKIAGSDLFLVDVIIQAGNHIVVFADKPEGISIDDCAEISRFIEANLDREVEDFELEVSSPGLFAPFKVQQQYLRHQGKAVSVVNQNGIKYSGILSQVTENEITLAIEKKVSIEGQKKRQLVKEELKINFNDIKVCKLVLNI
jgi:ribosome maturation factor RimP